MQQLSIPIHKSKLIFPMLGAIVFVILGFWLFFVVSHQQTYVHPNVISSLGLVSVLFFGFIGFLLLKKIIDKKSGVIISNKGIIDHSSIFNLGLIPWSDIIGAAQVKVMSKNFLMIYVNDPQNYINKGTTVFSRALLKSNYNTHGSPVAIHLNSLDYKASELEQLILEKITAN